VISSNAYMISCFGGGSSESASNLASRKVLHEVA
jgi:hypothetical protein